LLINPETGKVLFSKKATELLYPASCTKVAFALYAIKHHQALFNKKQIASINALKTVSEAQKSKKNFSLVPSYVLESDASHMGLKVGEEMSFYELLEATLVVSADDASNMIAEAMGNGSIERCVEAVNNYVKSLGCTDTHFMNPHGLHHPEHVSTAQDLALICREAMKEPLFRKMVKMARFQRPQTNKQQATVLQQTNRFLVKGSQAYYPLCVGIKTGYHRRAGYCLTAQAEKNGRSLLAVVLQASTSKARFQDTKQLFEAAFREEEKENLILPAGPQSFSREIEGGNALLSTVTGKPLTIRFYPSEEPAVRCQLVWHKLSLPVKEGAEVGELLLFADDRLVQKGVLLAANKVEMTWWYQFTHQMRTVTVAILLGLLALIIFFFSKRKN
jgi:D-alanyl-D-alanine carboxypeptidase (penicillin-binding protein 5/6)